MFSNPTHSYATDIGGNAEDEYEGRPGWYIEIDMFIGDFTDELGSPVFFKIAFGFRLRQAATCSAKGGSEVAYQIDLVWRSFGLDLENAIVNVLEVPVIQKSHHDA